MVGFRTLHEHNGDMYTNALLTTFTRLGVIKVNNLYTYGWGYNPCVEVALSNHRYNCVLDNLNI
jgi:hypothetical protein